MHTLIGKVQPPLTVYSDLYLRSHKPLNGVIKNLRDYTQLENNSLVCGYYFEEQDYTQTQKQLKKAHLSIFEIRKTVEYNAVLKNLYLQYDFDINVAAFRRKCFEKAEINNNSFRDYCPLIAVNNNGRREAYEQYFELRKLENVCGRVWHCSHSKRKKFGKIWASNSDLDRITPVKFRKLDKLEKLEKQESKEIDRDFNLSSLSVQELEAILLTEQRNEAKFKVRSLEDLRLSRNFPTLEPLLLKEEDEIDSEKIRLRISEHKKIVRITIAYTLAFFVLAIITFYIIYYA